jgi:hypothetical protein
MPVLEIEIIEDVAKNVSDYKKLYNEAGNDRKKILDVRAKIVKDVILDNFTNLMVDLYQVLVKNKASEESVYRKDIDKILKDKNTDPLAINSIYKLEDDSELLFIFSLVYAVNFPYDNEDIDITKDFSCGVEFLI